MQNDPELNGKYLGTISKDFVVVADTLKEAAYQVKKRGFSEYPIFPISKVDIPIGQLLIGRDELANKKGTPSRGPFSPVTLWPQRRGLGLTVFGSITRRSTRRRCRTR